METKPEEIKPEYTELKMTPQPRGSDIFGMFQTISVVPTLPPTNWFNQIQIYSSGGFFRIYVYEVVSKTWKYATLL